MSQFQVVCVCGGIGFPVGANGAPRIINVGRALQAAGIGYRVLHCGPTPAAVNNQRSGVYRDIHFEYTTWLTRPANTILRLMVYARAFAGLAVRLMRMRSMRHQTAVYLFVMDGPLVLYAGALCKLLGIPLVQEMNEWFPAVNGSAFLQWLYRKPIFAMASGMLVISKLIESRVRERAAAVNPRLLIHLLPSMVDSERFITAAPLRNTESEAIPNFLWCGVGYAKDVHFLLRAVALVNREGYRCKLRIVTATFLGWTPETILNYAAEQGLPADAIQFMVGVDDPTLESCYKAATANLLPLWSDDKSRTRMPNKLAEYLASGRPVITSAVGDLLDFLVDGVNAYVGQPGSERDFANNMISVVKDPAGAARIGARGQRTCLERLDYRFQIESLSKFFLGCIESGRAASGSAAGPGAEPPAEFPRSQSKIQRGDTPVPSGAPLMESLETSTVGSDATRDR
jgi:glycosyltransferase involved in cell wall biosynthesis